MVIIRPPHFEIAHKPHISSESYISITELVQKEHLKGCFILMHYCKHTHFKVLGCLGQANSNSDKVLKTYMHVPILCLLFFISFRQNFLLSLGYFLRKCLLLLFIILLETKFSLIHPCFSRQIT